MVKQINLDVDPIFKRSVMKITNTYNPKFSFGNKEFENEKELLSELSKNICEDFSEQLYPILLENLINDFYLHYEDNQ